MTSLQHFIARHLPDAQHSLATRIAEHFTPVFLEKGDFFLHEGRISQQYLYLESGYLRGYAVDPEGNEVTTNLFSPDSLVFEPASFFQRVPSGENIQALTAARGAAITFEELNNLFHGTPEFREFGRAILVKTLVSLQERTLRLISETAEQRYARLFHERRDLLQQVPLKHIASYLGITDSSLSRIRRESISKTDE